MKKQFKSIFLLSLILVMLFSSCSNANVDDSTKSFVDFFFSVYEPQDTMFGLYMDTMYDVATTLTEDETALEDAISILSDAYEQIESTSISDIVLDTDTETYMKEKGLASKELTGIPSVARSNQEFYLEAFDVLLYALKTGVPNKEIELEYVVAYASYQYQLIYLYVQYDYYTLNGFFSSLTEDEIKYTKSYLEDNSVVFNIEGVKWQNSAENAVVQANLVWDAIENFVGTEEE